MARSVLQIGSSFQSVRDAAESFELGAGKKMEALLATFEDLQDYRQAVKEYEESGGKQTYNPPDVRACLDARFPTLCMHPSSHRRFGDGMSYVFLLSVSCCRQLDCDMR